MRILVINVNRTGSTALCKGLSEYFNIPYFPTPFRKEVLRRPKDLEWYASNPNVLHQRIIEVDQPFLEKLIPIYKHVIITSRRIIEHASESYSYMLSRYNDKHDHYGSHTTRYYYEKPGNFEDIHKKVLSTEKIANNLSKKFNISITYYEDLFYNDPEGTLEGLNLNIDFNKFKHVLDTNKRLRVLEKGNLI